MREKSPRNLENRQYRKVNFFAIIAGIFFIFLLFLIFTSVMPAQDPVTAIRDWTKEVNVAVGKPIVNENTEKALKAVDRIPGLKQMLIMYNAHFGNDSVHALRFVDREPDAKSDDPIVRDNYDIVFVSDSVHQVARWWTFLVRKDFQEVRYYDQKKAKTTDLADWKKIWPANEFLKEVASDK
jgi:hypothetical protein